ncbi:hypothetical protein MtrunA17_Chr2g0314241 [Medicago truncatula]|uniref:Tify domain-containing protein n=1 Tax=Medicago truncatula TaxID=3880 RepID=A0A072V8Y9_MEDTR|nr:hypothetical protein MTR_2g072770 [Medicago truncatula]RHN74798.1 hypothetical protein MtrunA17_Chr2g0314241 [Medicago truncatula]
MINSTTISGDDAEMDKSDALISGELYTNSLANVVERENGVSRVSLIMVTPMKLGKPGKRFSVKLKDFLATGIMEGLKVRYVKGQKVVSPTVFELHAGSANKRPPEYTYLENGKFLRDVMNACSSLPLDTLDEVVQMVLGDFTMQKFNICFNCKGLKCTHLLS